MANGDNKNTAFNLFGKQTADQSIRTSASTESTSITRDIIQFADAAAGIVSSSSADEKQKAELHKLIEEIRAEGASPQPSKSKLREALDKLTSAATTAMGGIASAGLVAMVKALLGGLG